jgi:hypothetical protein
MEKKDTVKKPEVELIGIYREKHRTKIMATFHVYLADKDIDIRGGVIFKFKSGKTFIQMPQAHGTDEETGKRICFPVVSFTDADYEKAVRFEVIRVVSKELKKMGFD